MCGPGPRPLIYCGLRNGYGYRDTVQDIQGIIHLEPEMACEKIRFMLSAQVDNGGGLPLVKFTHDPGHEDTPDDLSYVQETGHPAYRADDALWLFPTVYKYVAETGNTAFLDEVIPFANRDEGTVYEHLKRAVQFSLDHLGPHGLPAGLYADWNDCLRLGANGESTFVALQFYYAMQILRQFACHRGAEADVQWLDGKLAEYESRIQTLCWDGDRFIRGYTETGERIGAAGDPEANFWLNPQSWAVISGLATYGQRQTIMDGVSQRLNTAYGAVLMDPPYHAHAFDGALAVIYNPGTKENAGIFSQSQGWLILAEALCGHGRRAFGYFAEKRPRGPERPGRDPPPGALLLRPVHRGAGQQALWALPGPLADRHRLHRNGGLRGGHPGPAARPVRPPPGPGHPPGVGRLCPGERFPRQKAAHPGGEPAPS